MVWHPTHGEYFTGQSSSVSGLGFVDLGFARISPRYVEFRSQNQQSEWELPGELRSPGQAEARPASTGESSTGLSGMGRGTKPFWGLAV